MTTDPANNFIVSGDEFPTLAVMNDSAAPAVPELPKNKTSWLAVASLTLGLVLILLVGILAVPWIVATKNQAPLVASVNNARAIVQACRVYADAHDGQLPDSLGVLVELQLIEETILNSPLGGQKGEMDYVLVTGYTAADGDKVLVYDRNTVRREGHVYYILGYVNGSAAAVKKVDVEAVLEQINREDSPIPRR